MELEKQPKGDLNINVSFGQFVCNKFGHNIENETLGVFAYMHCNETHSEHGVNVSAEHTQTLFTGLYSQQFITCRNSVFITQPKQSSSTTVQNSNASNTSPTPHSTISTISSTKASIFTTKGFK
jgi:glyceraldehyde-3-phosphate dehydrogenase/erythrose-4-phosphate dehydrogenase